LPPKFIPENSPMKDVLVEEQDETNNDDVFMMATAQKNNSLLLKMKKFLKVKEKKINRLFIDRIVII